MASTQIWRGLGRVFQRVCTVFPHGLAVAVSDQLRFHRKGREEIQRIVSFLCVLRVLCGKKGLANCYLLPMTGVRIDKWLWAARFFKSRVLAAKACELGRVQANHQPAKPAREIKAGDMLHIKTEGGEFEVEVLQLSEIRGPAAMAQTLYRETEGSKELRQKAREERKAVMNFSPAPAGRPSKRDRRRIIQFRSERNG